MYACNAPPAAPTNAPCNPPCAAPVAAPIPAPTAAATYSEAPPVNGAAATASTVVAI